MTSRRPSIQRPIPPAALVLSLLLAGCAGGIQLTDQWKDPAWTAPPMTNVYVVALRPDPERRRWWEDGFVAGLSRYHVRATASYKKYRDAPPDTQQVIEEVRANGYDGVLVSVRLPDVTSRSTSSQTSVVSEKRSFTSNYSTMTTEFQQSVTKENTVRSVQTDVWSPTGGGRLVWTGIVRTSDNVGYDKVQKVAAIELPDRFAKDGLLPPRPPGEK